MEQRNKEKNERKKEKRGECRPFNNSIEAFRTAWSWSSDYHPSCEAA